VLTSTPYKKQLEKSKINTKHDTNATRPKASAKKQLSFKQKAKQSGKQNAKKKSKRSLANDHEADATKVSILCRVVARVRLSRQMD